MAGRVEGKVALVTGGASGIGRATALTFAREGAKLVVADMNEDGGQQTVHMITENGGEAIFVQVDAAALGLSPAGYAGHDLLTGERYRWLGGANYVQLDPARRVPAHILRLETSTS